MHIIPFWAQEVVVAWSIVPYKDPRVDGLHLFHCNPASSVVRDECLSHPCERVTQRRGAHHRSSDGSHPQSTSAKKSKPKDVWALSSYDVNVETAERSRKRVLRPVATIIITIPRALIRGRDMLRPDWRYESCVLDHVSYPDCSVCARDPHTCQRKGACTSMERETRHTVYSKPQ